MIQEFRGICFSREVTLDLFNKKNGSLEPRSSWSESTDHPVRERGAAHGDRQLPNWQRTSEFNKTEQWIFASSFKAGKKPWQPWRVQQRDISPAAVRCGIGRIGWHTFRHTFRSLLDETRAPLKAGIDTPLPHPNNDEHLRKNHGEEQS
jgi:integrase